MFTLKPCYRKNLCVDCDDPNCAHAGNIEADCPKWKCGSEDCENCEFIKEFQKDMRKGFNENRF